MFETTEKNSKSAQPQPKINRNTEKKRTKYMEE